MSGDTGGAGSAGGPGSADGSEAREGVEGREGLVDFEGFVGCGGELRKAARVVLLDSQDRILLMHGYEPDDPADHSWFTPGGGLEEGETWAEAALRELAEETGVTEVELGPVLWRRRCSFPFDGRRWEQDEWYFLARTDQTGTGPLGLTELERRSVTGSRWWTSAELASTRETVYPTRLAELLRTLLDEGPPPVPVVLAPEIA